MSSRQVANFQKLNEYEQSKCVGLLLSSNVVFNVEQKNEKNTCISAKKIKKFSTIENQSPILSSSVKADKENKSVIALNFAAKMKKIINRENKSPQEVFFDLKQEQNPKNISKKIDNKLLQIPKSDNEGTNLLQQKSYIVQLSDSTIVENKKQEVLDKLSRNILEAKVSNEQDFNFLNLRQKERFVQQQQQQYSFQDGIDKHVILSQKRENSSNRSWNKSQNDIYDNSDFNISSKEGKDIYKMKIICQNDKRKSRNISQELMDKNMKYISQLQQKKKEKKEPKKANISPIITPRKTNVLNSIQSNNKRMYQENEKLRISKSPIIERVKTSPKSREKSPTTFQQFKIKQQNLAMNSSSSKKIKTSLTIRMNNDVKYSQVSEKSMIQNSKFSQEYKGGTICTQESQLCQEYGSFGSLNNISYSLIQEKVNNNTDKDILESSKQSAPDKLLKQNKKKKDEVGQEEKEQEEDGFKMYNIKSLKPQQGQRKNEFNQYQKNDSLKPLNKEINLNAGESALQELRQFIDLSLNLRPIKVPINQILKMMDELYQANFCQNTLMLKITSKNNNNSNVDINCSNQFSQGNNLEMEIYDFSIFILEYFEEKYAASKKMCQQHLLNLITSVDYFLSQESKYPPNHAQAIRTFAEFVQNKRSKEELIFFLFVREMLIKCVTPELKYENDFQETIHIELSSQQCQQVLVQVYGQNEQQIIDRFMFRLNESLLDEASWPDMKIGANFFLNLVLQDYIEGKANKICESKQSTSEEPPLENLQPEDSYQKIECTFEKSFGDHSQTQDEQVNQVISFQLLIQKREEQQNLRNNLNHLKKFSTFIPVDELQHLIWEKMKQKIMDFLSIMISDTHESTFSPSDKKKKIETVQKIVTSKISKMLSSLTEEDGQRWTDLLCISSPSQCQLEYFRSLTEQLHLLQETPLQELRNSQISSFSKNILQTKELSKAIGKLLLCILMPYQSNQNEDADK